MKFSTTLILSSAAFAAAAVVPKDAYKENTCPVVKKVVKLSWIEEKAFTKAHVKAVEEVKEKIDKSKFDPKQVYPHLNQTNSNGGKGGYSTKPSSVRLTSSAKPTGTPYPTTGYYNGTGPTGTLSSTWSVFPTGRVSTSASSSSSTKATTTSTSTSSSAEASATLQAEGCPVAAVRQEWRSLSDSQRDAYVSAIGCLMRRPSGDSSRFVGSRNRFEDFTSLHQQQAGKVHSSGYFLVFHRYFLNVFESVLRDECGFQGTLPWWDETLDAGSFSSAPMFTPRWFGEMAEGHDGQGTCITESGWGEYTTNLGPDDQWDNPHCLSRAVNNDWSGAVDQGAVDNCRGAANYDDYRWCNEYTFHGMGHNAIGAVMSNPAASPADPAFFLHHAFVDRNYKVWQNDQWWNRVFEVGGDNLEGGVVGPDDILTSYDIRPSVRVSEVLDTQGNYLCYEYDKQ